MLKKLDSSQLRVGMFIHDLDCGWMEHPFVRNQFLVTNEAEIRKIVEARIRGVVIECGRGLDVEAPTATKARPQRSRSEGAWPSSMGRSIRCRGQK